MSKYKAVRTNGYASAKEAKRAAELKLLLKAGEIWGLLEQVPFELAPSVVIQGRKRPPLRYFCDFYYYTSQDMKNLVVEDCKGFRSPVYIIKRHLMKTVLSIDILET